MHDLYHGPYPVDMTVGEARDEVLRMLQEARPYVPPIKANTRLDRITDKLLNIIAGIEDEGDRAYFGSTNDADTLREIAHEMDAARNTLAARRGQADE